MVTKKDLEKSVADIFRDAWETREGQVVPEPKDLKLSNDAVEFDRATILYADLKASTNLVDTKVWYFAAEIYKTYLLCCANIIRDMGGEVVAYDGDRVMGMYIGGRQSNSAAKTALKIHWTVTNIINPALVSQYKNSTYQVKQVVGVDTSSIKAARTGVRGDNDIVWVGRAANYAAKLTDLDLKESSWITAAVYNYLDDELKTKGDQKIWTKYKWTQNKDQEIYGTAWHWSIN